MPLFASGKARLSAEAFGKTGCAGGPHQPECGR